MNIFNRIDKMKKLPVASAALLLVTLFRLSSFAQDIKWNTAPRKGFVFQINNKEAQKLLIRNSPDTIFNGLLHTQIDTFDVRKGWTNRPSQGHFIMAINYGEAIVSITRSVEQAHFQLATGGEEISVIDAMVIICLCGDCGNKFDAGVIAKIIKAIPSGSSDLNDN